MATVTATYAPATGRQAVTLTSWAGSAAFATTPTAGSQIEGAITANFQGIVNELSRSAYIVGTIVEV